MLCLPAGHSVSLHYMILLEQGLLHNENRSLQRRRRRGETITYDYLKS